MLKSKSHIAIPPGATIKEQLENRGITQKEFAARMGMSEKHISKLINGDVALTYDVANRLEFVLGMPASFWNNLECLYREQISKVNIENSMENDKKIAVKFPIKEIDFLTKEELTLYLNSINTDNKKGIREKITG